MHYSNLISDNFAVRRGAQMLVCGALIGGCGFEPHEDGLTSGAVIRGQGGGLEAHGSCDNPDSTINYFLSPGRDPAGDAAWQASVSGFTEFDFDDLAPGATVDYLQAGDLLIDVGLGGVPGVVTRASTFSSGAFAYPGVFYRNSLLNGEPVHSRITFSFSEPVEGVGAWIFDDTMALPQSFRILVTDVMGAVTASPVLESGNGLAHAVEGFIGVTSAVGITQVSVENLEGVGCNPSALSYFEIDYLQIGNPVGDACDRDGDGDCDAGDYCPGVSTPTPAASDGEGIACVVNLPPNCEAASINAAIWPPNHKLVPVTIAGVSDPEGAPLTISVTGIFQDEPTNGFGDGDAAPDAAVIGGVPHIRAERAGTSKSLGNGRVYHVTFTASDGQGGTCSGVGSICVPHDQNPNRPCIDDGPLYDSFN